MLVVGVEFASSVSRGYSQFKIVELLSVSRSRSPSSSSSDSRTDEYSSDNESDISENPRFRENLSSCNITVNSIPLPAFTIDEDITHFTDDMEAYFEHHSAKSEHSKIRLAHCS